jgi:two-component system, OmpR family, copper resistance phosphate regulon response regulator CusR
LHLTEIIMENINILIVEDEQRLAEVLKNQLEDSGYKVHIASDGYLGKQHIEKHNYNLVILDINLPLINGYDLCKEIRKVNKQIPIIMLTALGTTDNKILGFDVGADDYMVKPFDIRELLARVNVFLKRSEIPSESDNLSVADLVMDVVTKTVTRSGQRIELTAKEYLLLEILLKSKGKLLPRDQIISQVWGIDFDPGTNVLDVYINYLRKKIDKNYEPKLICTKFGFGFYLNEKEI